MLLLIESKYGPALTAKIWAYSWNFLGKWSQETNTFLSFKHCANMDPSNINNNKESDKIISLDEEIATITQLFLSAVAPTPMQKKETVKNIITVALILLFHPQTIGTLAILHQNIQDEKLVTGPVTDK